MTPATPPPPPPPITASDLLAAAWRHRLTLARGTTLALGSRRCCAIGALAVLINPDLVLNPGDVWVHGDGPRARGLVRVRIGNDAFQGLEDGFEGWPFDDTACSDRPTYYHWRAIGEALAREAGVVPGEDEQR